MKRTYSFITAFLALVFATAALAQNTGTVTQNAFAIGRGPGATGFAPLLCGTAQLAVGQNAAAPICRTMSGDATFAASGAFILNTVTANVGTFGSATQCLTVTNNAKGLTTAISATTCTPDFGNLTGVISVSQVGTGGALHAVPVDVAGNIVWKVISDCNGSTKALNYTQATDLFSCNSAVTAAVNANMTGEVTSVGNAASLGSFTSARLRAALTDETGTGAAYFQGGDIGTPSAGVGTNFTGIPISTGIVGMGTNIPAWLVTPNSANLRAALTDESGTGAAYFQGGDIGTPSAGVGTNLTNIPAGALTGTVPLANGGLAANLAASNGGIFYSTATAGAILAGTATARLPLLSGATAPPVWSAFTLPASVSSGGLAYFSSTSAMASSSAPTVNGVIYGSGAGSAPGSTVAGINGQFLLGVTGAAPNWGSMSQDCTITNAGVVTCTKTNNVSFAASATIDATNAANIGSGILPAGRLPNPSASTLGGIQSLVSSASKWINAISTSGVPSATQPAFTDISGSVAAGQMPALTGDCTTSAGAVATTCTKINGVDQVGAWTTFTPTVTCTGGTNPTLNAVSTNGSAFQLTGKSMRLRYQIQTTAIGTCSGFVQVAIPNSKTAAAAVGISGAEYATGAWGVQGATNGAGATLFTLGKFDGTIPLDVAVRGFALTGIIEVQ